MIAVDTNILIYAHRAEMPFYKKSDKLLTELVESTQDWAIAWPSIHEFIAVVTNPKIFKTPTPLKDALIQVDCWLESPYLNLLSENSEYWEVLKEMATKAILVGAHIHDIRIAALCVVHHVKTLWSADRDFSHVSGLKVMNPLL